MSYNIDTWTTIECALTAPGAVLDSKLISEVEYGRPGVTTDVFLSFDAEDEAIEGTLTNDVLSITEFKMRSNGSGQALHDHVMPWLELTRGALCAVLVWEGGDSITLLDVRDGVVTDKPIDVAALLRENADLRRQIEENQ